MSVSKRKSQPYQIKGVDALLGGESLVAAEFVQRQKIELPPQQPRRYFDPKGLQELVESIKRHGILSPLLVRPKGLDKYELVAGERRYRAATEAGLNEVPVVIQELNDSEAYELALLENLQREDLNTVEETEGILELLAKKLNRTQEEVIVLLNRAAHPERDSVDNVIHSKDWMVVQEVFASLGKFTPESFRTNRLPLLNLPDEILQPLRQGSLAYTKARTIAKVEDPFQRKELLDAAISENLSLSQIRERIKTLKGSKSSKPKKKSLSLKGRMTSIFDQAKKPKVWKAFEQSPEKKAELENILERLEVLFGEKK
ncbi:MAG: ParB/RepB/Spo0J family partition protein [Coleofasciculaceae cyanobacterium]